MFNLLLLVLPAINFAFALYWASQGNTAMTVVNGGAGICGLVALALLWEP